MSVAVNLIVLVLFGAFAGWLTAQIMGLKTEFWGNALLGIVGAALGGAVVRGIGGPGLAGFSIYSLLVSVGGACLLVWIVRMIDSNRMKRR